MEYYSAHPEKAICLDVETTGVDPNTAEILQLSIIDFNGNVLFNKYIKPDKAKDWPGAERVHHISPNKVMEKPHLHYYHDTLKRIFDNAELIIAYNGDHYDIPILVRYGFPELGIKKSFDVMLKFAPIYGAWDDYHGSYTWQKLSVCADYYGYSNSDASFHDSLEDVRATLYCYKKMMASVDSDHTTNEYEDIIIECDDDDDYEYDDYNGDYDYDDYEYEYTDEDAVRDTQPFWVGAKMEMESSQNESSDDEFIEEYYEDEAEVVEPAEDYYVPSRTYYYPSSSYDRDRMNILDEIRDKDSGFYPEHF